MEGSVTAALLEEYSMSRSEAVRNEIVLKNLGLVRSCALSLRNTYIKYGEVGDVVNEGVIALMDAIETYDPSRGAKFETYASLKIRGAIIDYVRKQDWVPRPVRKFARDLDNANTILYNQYDRAPTTAELAEYLQISEEKLLRGMADELSACYRAALKAGCAPAGRLLGSGNGLRRNPALQRAVARSFGLPLTLAAVPEEAACGAALFARMGMQEAF